VSGQPTLEDFLLVRKTAADELAPLTHAEREVLVLVSKGCNVKEAAVALGISASTVAGRIKTLHARLRMTTTEAVVLAVKAGWV